jgi:RNA polymerase sigma-70 factor, ECF subfamily
MIWVPKFPIGCGGNRCPSGGRAPAGQRFPCLRFDTGLRCTPAYWILSWAEAAAEAPMKPCEAMSTPLPLPFQSPGAADIDDRIIIARLRGGEASALDELMRRYWAPLVAYSRDILGSREAAQDVVQDVLIKVWELRADWTPSGSIRGYLYRLVRNRAIDELRKQRVRRFVLPLLGRQPPTPAEDLADRELQEEVERAIAALPLRRREVFVLAHSHQLSHRQIAEIMGISVQTVANQMSSALADLRRALRQHIPSPSEPC